MPSDRPVHHVEPAPRADLPDDVLAMHVEPSDWRLIVSVRPNVLLEGPTAASERLIDMLVAVSPDPVQDWRQAADRAAMTLVVRCVDALTRQEQQDLMRRLDGSGGQPMPRQVISTSGTPLFSMVERGQFLSQLYYRLNSIRVQVWETT